MNREINNINKRVKSSCLLVLILLEARILYLSVWWCGQVLVNASHLSCMVKAFNGSNSSMYAPKGVVEADCRGGSFSLTPCFFGLGKAWSLY